MGLTWEEKRDRIKKRKRDLFLLVSLQVFEEKGFNNTRISDIAERAEASVGSFYFYFQNKEELLEGILNKFYELFMFKLKRLSKQGLPPLKDIKDVFLDYAVMFKEKKETALIYIEQMGGINKKFANMKNQIIEDWCIELEKILIKLIKNKTEPDIETTLISRAWLGAVLEIVHWWILTDFKMDMKKMVDLGINFLMTGIVGLNK